MTPELKAAIERLIGAALNAEVELQACIDDPRVPYWVETVARRNTKALATAIEQVKAAIKEAETANE